MDKFPYLLQKGPPVFERRYAEELPSILTVILTKEVQAFVHVRDSSLFRREFQPAFPQEGFHQWFDPLHQQLFGDAGAFLRNPNMVRWP